MLPTGAPTSVFLPAVDTSDSSHTVYPFDSYSDGSGSATSFPVSASTGDGLEIVGFGKAGDRGALGFEPEDGALLLCVESRK